MKRIAYLLVVSLLIGCGGGGGGGGGSGEIGATAPTATTAGASSVSISAAALHGSVNPNGTNTTAWFDWGINSALLNPSSTAKISVGSGTMEQSINESIGVLTQGTTYYYRIVAQNSGGITNGSIVSFTTALPLSTPSVSTYAATSVTGTGAQLNGIATPNGFATNAWFEWGTGSTLTSFTTTPAQAIGAGNISVNVNDNLSGLTTGQTYYFRAAAINSLGTVKGSVASFIAGTSPSVTTQAATSILDKEGTLNGVVSPNGLATTAWFEWGTDSALVSSTSTSSQSVGSGTTSQSVNAALTGLTTGTTYYYRVVAGNSSGTTRGSIASFVPGGVPAVTTLAATSVGANTATLNGNVTANGMGANAWFEWGTNPALASYASTPVQSLGSGTTGQLVSAALTGLSTGTTYYCRVAASNSSGTSKGTIVSFTVIPPQPDPGVADIRDEFLAAVNQARSVNQVCGTTPYGIAPLVSWSDNLAMAAYLHSEDMALNNFFSHTGSDGSSPGQRISRQGYPWRAYGENIAVGYPTVSSVIQGWLGSEGHCQNLMDPDFTEIGAGYAIGPFEGNPAARYWTFDLADR